MDTLGDLLTLCNDRGRSWWRQVPRIGPRAADTMVRALQRFAPTPGELGAHVTGEALPVPMLAVPLQPGTGLAGANRAETARCRIAADNDYQAIQTWLSLRPKTSHTYRAYRKEAERFLALATIERGKAFSSLLSSTLDILTRHPMAVDNQSHPFVRWRCQESVCHSPRAATSIIHLAQRWPAHGVDVLR